jgi:hypothetical protein
MISIEMALSLKGSGLLWEPKLHDFFTIPDTPLKRRMFVVNDMMIDVQQLFGKQMITFNGTVEWSLDYITIAEAVWLPTEAQLRESLMQRLFGKAVPLIMLESTAKHFTCELTFERKPLAFKAESASDAYARALLYMLEH